MRCNVPVRSRALRGVDPVGLALPSLAALLALLPGCGGGSGGNSQAPASGSSDPGVTIQVEPARAEESGQMLFIVRAAFGEVEGSVTVQYSIEGASADAGADFEPASGRLEIRRRTGAEPTVERKVSVELLDDAMDEDDEVIRLALANPKNARLLVSSADGKIIDDDPEPSLSVSDAVFTEGSAETAFVIGLSAVSGREVRVAYATKEGSARAGRDYAPLTGTAVFLPGDREKTVSVQVLDDGATEGEETFFLALSKPANAVLAVPRATGRIGDPPDAVSGLDERPLNDGCTFPEKPSGDAGFAPAFRNLWRSSSLAEAVGLLQAPGDGSRWFAVRRTGLVVVFENDDSVESTDVFLDIEDRVKLEGEGGLLGMAFHPGFPSVPEAFLFYTAPGDPLETRISRFRSPDGGSSLSARSEEILIRLPQKETFHKGGHLAFGPDGFLYAGLGDDGSKSSAQDANRLTGKLLRIDVDTASGYRIPLDNPFAASGGGRPEVYAWGFRNPWRWSFDRSTGELWLGDVGEVGYEEIDRVQLGGNHGWPIREGRHCVKNGCSTSGLIDPVYEWSHEEDGARAVIGGHVYRGSAVPELAGSYIFGDWGLRRVWALSRDGGGAARVVGDLPEGVLFSFAEDVDGEIHALIGGRRIYRMVSRADEDDNALPSKLSDLPCVHPSDPSRPAAWLIPYDINVPFWSDGATKERWFALPDGERITVGDDGDWDLPPGSVTMKTFKLDGRLVETRLLVRREDGAWAGYSYEWNDAGTDAELLDSGKTKQVGGRTWKYPSRSECLGCHTDAAGGTLGLETAQLNRAFLYKSTGRTGNQLATLNAIGLLASPLVGSPADLPAFPRSNDASAPLDDRARAYLHVNCSHCHRPGGPTRGSADFRYSVPLEDTQLCDRPPTEPDPEFLGATLLSPGDPASSLILIRMLTPDSRHMPPIGGRTVDVEGTSLVESWVASLTGCR